MKLPRSKSIIAIFSIVFVVIMSISIPLAFVQREKKQMIDLNKNNFERYFDFDFTYSQINTNAQVRYDITPRLNYYDEQSVEEVKCTIAIVFYSQTYVNKREYVSVSLKKKNKYMKSGNTSVKVPDSATEYKIYISHVEGVICFYEK